MSDRIRTLTVILDNDYAAEDAARIVDAISMTRGVLDVRSGPEVSATDYTNRQLAKFEIAETLGQLVKSIYGIDGGKWEQIRELLKK